MSSSTEAAFRGCILGLAAGDALGFPPEFRSRAQILKSFGPAGIRDLIALQDERWPGVPFIAGRAHPPGTYSDDTQMTLALAHGLRDAQDLRDVDGVMKCIAGHFVEWSRSDDNDRAPGNACMTGCSKLAQGVPWREAGVADSKGCGSAMRVAPIGLVYAKERDTLLDVARASSVLTHGHSAGIEGAAAAALLVALAMEQTPPKAMWEALMEMAAGRSPDFEARLAQLPEMMSQPPEVALSSAGLGESWVAEEAIASALYCFWRTPESLEETLVTAANTDGDSDSIACIAGSIAGAFHGVDAIPARWLEKLENREGLVAVADELAELAL